MSLIRPFSALRPLPEHAEAVIAPPYDVLNTQEARQRAAGRPWSFLHISKPEIDLPEDIDIYADVVYAKGLENLQQQRKQGILRQEAAPCYYLYRLIMGTHQQTGLVAVANVEDYNRNRIRKHELTRPDKEDDRVKQIDVLDAQTGPVFLTYPHHHQVDELVDNLTKFKPEYDVTAEDGIRHTLWVVNDATHIHQLTQVFDAMPYLYIADGHHRSAAAARVAAMRAAKNPKHTGEEPYNYFLAVLFPDNQVQILDYNRVIKDLNGFTPTEFLTEIRTRLNVVTVEHPYKPQKTAEFSMYLAGQWYCLTIDAEKIPTDDPVASLDVSLLADHIIAPLLGITDPRRDKRIDFVGGIRGLTELQKRVDSGEMAVAFALYPTQLSALMAVADAEKLMPPKSTWFEPKLADGLVSHLLSDV